MKRILIDMDDVMAETSKKILSLYNEMFGTGLAGSDFVDKKFNDVFSVENYQLVRNEIYKKGFFEDLEVKTDAVRVIKELNEKYEVYVVSAATEFPNSLSEKIRWLHEHFAFISWKRIVLCGDKHMISADIMIDDHTKNLSPFLGERTLLFDAIHNQNVTGYERVKKWQEVADKLL